MKLGSNTLQLLSKEIWFRGYHYTLYFQLLGPSVPHADLQRIKTAVEDTSAFHHTMRPLLPSESVETFLKISPRRPCTELYRAIIM